MQGGSRQRRFFPLFFKLNGQKVLVVGGGSVAVRKVRQLLNFGAEITVISPELAEELQELVTKNKLKWIEREYSSSEAGDYSLVIATTDDNEVNLHIYNDSVSKNIPINIVDKPELCTVFFPSIVSRGDMTIAIGSDGRAPFFTRAVRKELEKLIPQEYEKKVELSGIFREFVSGKNISSGSRQGLFERFLSEIETKLADWKVSEPPYDNWQKWIDEADECT